MGVGAKEERVEESPGRGHAWEFLFNFSKVTENEELSRSRRVLSAQSQRLEADNTLEICMYVHII